MAPMRFLLPAPRGSFKKGNRGRRPGSRNQSTLLGAALLQDQGPDLIRKGLALAKAGNVVLLKFFLSCILPPERTVTIDLPAVNCADDALSALGAIMYRVADGTISPSEGAEFAAIVEPSSRAIDRADVSKSMELLEKEVWNARA